MRRRAPRAIAVSRGLRLEAGMGNSPFSDPQQSGGDGQATVLVNIHSTLQTIILDEFADNNIRTLPPPGRLEMLRQLVRWESAPGS